MPKFFNDGRGDVVTTSPIVKISEENAVERLRRRLKERFDADVGRHRSVRKTQRDLAEKLGIAEGTLSELLNGTAAKRGLLAHLDKIAKYFGVPPSLLVHRNDTALMEIAADEYRLLKHWRSFPPDVQERISEMFDYFAGLLPEEKEQRRLWMVFSRLHPPARERIEEMMRRALQAQHLERRRGGAADPAPGSEAATAAVEPQETVKRRAGR